MAEVTGPINTLPGAFHSFPEGTMCDEHPERLAVVRIQGETDSFGCEMYDLCKECLDAYREAIRTEDTSGECDWCKTRVEKTRPARDYEEGTCGRVYYVCEPCYNRQQKRLEIEYDYYGD